jgi:hypothetical protein
MPVVRGTFDWQVGTGRNHTQEHAMVSLCKDAKPMDLGPLDILCIQEAEKGSGLVLCYLGDLFRVEVICRFDAEGGVEELPQIR